MEQSYKQIFTELLAKVVSLEVEKKQLEDKVNSLTQEINKLHVQRHEQEKPKNPLEEVYKKLSKLNAEVANSSLYEEVEKTYPNLFPPKEEKKVEDETVYMDVADLGKNFIKIFMEKIMDELDSTCEGK